MKPSPDQILPKLALQILTQHRPAFGDTYQGSEVQLIAMCLFMAGEYAANGVHRLIAEATALRELFAAQADAVTDADLANRLRQAASEVPPAPATAAEAQAQLNELRTLLIEHQSWVEVGKGFGSAENKAIWALLASHHEAGRLQSMKFLAEMSATEEEASGSPKRD